MSAFSVLYRGTLVAEGVLAGCRGRCAAGARQRRDGCGLDQLACDLAACAGRADKDGARQRSDRSNKL